MAKFTVDRKTWYRGKGGIQSALLTEHGERCCIGFVGQQCGVVDKLMLGVPTIHYHQPMDGYLNAAQFPAWMTYEDHGSKDVDEAYLVNDNRDISDLTREAKLKEIFARHGDELEFIN